MPPSLHCETLLPFLYPLLHRAPARLARSQVRTTLRPRTVHTTFNLRNTDHLSPPTNTSTAETPNSLPESHTNPLPSSYSHNPFIDRTRLTLHAGAGGHGTVSFHREKYIEHGPPNGGDGGSGGNIYIQAVTGESSLHKLSRKRELRAGRGRNGRGKNQGGERGEDVLFTVPVGTVVREMWRYDPVEEERLRVREIRSRRRALRKEKKVKTRDLSASPFTPRDNEASSEEAEFGDQDQEQAQAQEEEIHEDEEIDINAPAWKKDRWIAYPGLAPRERKYHTPPPPPRRRTTTYQALQPASPITLDLDTPMETPLLLAAGASGGVGNPHFISPDLPRPKFATRGEPGMRLCLSLELKMLADVGLVGLPNAGKSTLLRALSNSRTRVGNWAFTTLQPVIGTVVLDDFKGRPKIAANDEFGRPRTGFTVADIPGLIEDAHLDRGLGLGFLRHVERAKVLSFVVDLSRGGAVAALKSLWKEVGEYERLKGQEVNELSQKRFRDAEGMVEAGFDDDVWMEPLVLPPVSAKPWFVVATKADLEGTREEFEALKSYLARLRDGEEAHPSGNENGWRKGVRVVPVCALRAEGVEGIPNLVVDLLGPRS